MTFAEINKRFTAKTLEFMAEGYYINTSGLTYLTCGCSHEYCHLELTNGEDIILMVIAESGVSFTDLRKVSIEIYEAKKDVLDKNWCRPNMMRGANHIGAEKCNLIYSEDFYQLDYNNYQKDWFGTEEEAKWARAVHDSRTRNRRWAERNTTIREETLPKSYHKIALKHIRRTWYSSYKLSDITAVKKQINYYGKKPKVSYYIEAKGKHFTLS